MFFSLGFGSGLKYELDRDINAYLNLIWILSRRLGKINFQEVNENEKIVFMLASTQVLFEVWLHIGYSGWKTEKQNILYMKGFQAH